jgi:hypothetical protein
MSEYSVTYTLEWLNGNMHRNYPIADSAVPQDVDGQQYLPSSFLTDLQLIVPYVDGIDASKFFISTIQRTGNNYTVTIGYLISDPDDSTIAGFDCAVSAPIPANVIFDSSSPHSFEVAAITSTPSDTDPSYTYGIPSVYEAMKGMRGTIYIGTCSDMAGIGALQFHWANTAIIPTCVYIESANEQLRSIRVIDSYGTDTTFTQDLTLQAGTGIQIEQSDETITFKIDQTYVNQQIAAFLQTTFSQAVMTINGAEPDASGNIQITGLDCTDIRATAHGITINNPCAKPCCDQNGADTADITVALEQLNADKTALNNYYTDLATKVNSMQSRLASLIASRK